MAVETPLGGLTDLQSQDVRKRMAGVGTQIMSKQLTTVAAIDAAIDQATRNLSFNRKHYVQALQDQARGYSREMKNSLNDEVCNFLGLQRPAEKAKN